MQVEYQNTKQDYISFYRLSQTALQWQISLFVLCIAFLLTMTGQVTKSAILYFLIYVVPLLAAIYLMPFLYNIIKIRQTVLKYPGLFNLKTLLITDEGLIIREGESKKFRNWGSIVSLDLVKHFACIKLLDKEIILIPEKAFQSKNDEINFLGLIRSKLLTQQTELKRKPPYALGFLSIIPFVGGVAGLILIFLGIFKYKDIWLVIMGVIGVTVTLIIYMLFAFNNDNLNSKQMRETLALNSQEEINSLVKEIEFYKLQYGVYPDKLNQLKISDFTSIEDPLTDDKKQRQEYNYHRIGKKYTLFSSGIDGIPNTADDIYPSIAIDTSKIGLVINRK